MSDGTKAKLAVKNPQDQKNFFSVKDTQMSSTPATQERFWSEQLWCQPEMMPCEINVISGTKPWIWRRKWRSPVGTNSRPVENQDFTNISNVFPTSCPTEIFKPEVALSRMTSLSVEYQKLEN